MGQSYPDYLYDFQGFTIFLQKKGLDQRDMQIQEQEHYFIDILVWMDKHIKCFKYPFSLGTLCIARFVNTDDLVHPIRTET